MFKELFKAELAKNGIGDKRADRILMWLKNPDTVSFPLSADWNEQEHPRAEDGKFTSGTSRNYSPGGEDRASMTKTEARKWDKIGSERVVDKRITQKKAEIAKLKKRAKMFPDNASQESLVKAQRELAELTRDIKLENRKKLEGQVSKRVMAKKVKKYQEIDDEIDYMEEKYADRTPGSPTQDQVVFPKTKSGEKAKAKYDSLIAERNDLDEEIDWEQVEKDL